MNRPLPSAVLLREIETVRSIISRYAVDNPRLFGSVARGEDKEGSDIDILVDKREDLSLFDLGKLTVELEELLGVEVDVVLANTLRHHVRPSVLRDARPL